MIRFPNAKVNLSLRVGKKRSDGYHEIKSLFYPIPFFDILEIVPSKKLRFQNSGIRIPGNPTENLILKSYDLVSDQFDLPPVSIHIHKAIPMGAGLGGGSSDASFTLMLLNELFELNMKNSDLADLALKLGSDCPFFILNEPAIVSGRGEKMEKSDFKLSGKYLVLVNPGIHISTAEAYGNLPNDRAELSNQNLDLSGYSIQGFGNDFQSYAESKFPELGTIRSDLDSLGSIYSGMSGSGSSYFGLFETKPNQLSNKFKGFDTRVLKLS